MTDSQPQILLEVTDIWKSFPGVTALRGVSLGLRGGEVHALLGENGAGKSTLMAVAAGTIHPDSGAIAIGGETLARLTPAAAQRHRVAMVHQHPAVVPDLTVAENLALAAAGVRPTEAWMREQLERVELRVPLGARLEDLTRGRPAAARADQGDGARAEGADPRRADRAAGRRPGEHRVRPGQGGR